MLATILHKKVEFLLETRLESKSLELTIGFLAFLIKKKLWLGNNKKINH